MRVVLFLCLIAVATAFPRERKGRPDADRSLDSDSDDHRPWLSSRSGQDDRSSDSDEADSSMEDTDETDDTTEEKDKTHHRKPADRDHRRRPEGDDSHDNGEPADERPEGSTRRPDKQSTPTGTRPTMTTDRKNSEGSTRKPDEDPQELDLLQPQTGKQQ